MKVYYAHCVGIYNTPQEKRDITTLTELGFEVVNPNDWRVQRQFDALSGKMEYMEAFTEVFFTLIDGCEIFAFRALPHGSITAGVVSELKYAQAMGKLIIELPACVTSRAMSVDETCDYLKEMGNR